MNRTYPWFDYDDWLETEPDHYPHEEVYDEDEAYDRWVDDQLTN